MPNTKEYLKFDIGIALPIAVYYFITRGQLASSTSTGIQVFYMIEVGVAVLIQILLAVFDSNEAKAWVASLRAGAIVYMLGMAAIVTKLGLLSVWFILLFCLVQGFHLCMLLDQAKEKDYSGYQYVNEGSNAMEGQPPYQFNYNQVSDNSNNNQDQLTQNLIAQQRTNFFEQQKILQEIQKRQEEERLLREQNNNNV